jgi:hypothetical protein
MSASSDILIIRRVLFGIGVTSGILCFVPFFAGQSSQLEQTPLRNALSQVLWRDSSLVSLTLSVLIAAELVIETLQKPFERFLNGEEKCDCEADSDKYGGTKSVLGGSEKLLFLLGMAVNPIVTLILHASPISTSIRDQCGLLYLCSRMSQICMVGIAVITCIFRLDPIYFPDWVVVLTAICFSSGSIAGVFVSNTPVYRTSVGNKISIEVALLLFAAVIWALVTIRALFLRLRDSSLFRKGNTVKPESGKDKSGKSVHVCRGIVDGDSHRVSVVVSDGGQPHD